MAESSLEQLKTLDVGSWKNKKYKGTQIPTISEVFATVPKGKKIFVEVKCGLEIIPYLVKEIHKSDLKMNQVQLICFNQGVIKALKETMLNYKVYWLTGFKNKQGTWKPSLEEVLGTSSSLVKRMDSIRSIRYHKSLQSCLKSGFRVVCVDHQRCKNSKKTGKERYLLDNH